jgi:hypothetical protein
MCWWATAPGGCSSSDRDDHSIDIDCLRGLSADAVPALDTLAEPLRSCVLKDIERSLRTSDTSRGQSRARDILRKRGSKDPAQNCDASHRGGGSSYHGGEQDDQYDPYDPY